MKAEEKEMKSQKRPPQVGGPTIRKASSGQVDNELREMAREWIEG